LAQSITSKLSIPTIGIGAGLHCDGQVLVCYDLLGMIPNFKPKFVKQYADLFGGIQQAAQTFFSEVRSELFPDEAHSFKSKSIRLVASNPDPEPAAERDEKAVYGVPV
jgi:3-methyl-2-oxobutanoate hydroxymethyltransferase